jgi:hypothetical protein
MLRSLSIALGVGLIFVSRASSAQTPPDAGQRFFAALEGDWVGTAQQRVEGQEPLTRYFHLAVRRQDARTFVITVSYFRPDPKSGALEAAGSEQGSSTLAPDGTVERRAEGSGSVLVDGRPKPETHSATGRARATAAGTLAGEASGTIRLQGLPLGLGRRGKIERAREEWTVKGDVLTGSTAFVACFRAFLFSKRYRVETTCRAERGSDVAALAAHEEIARATAH